MVLKTQDDVQRWREQYLFSLSKMGTSSGVTQSAFKKKGLANRGLVEYILNTQARGLKSTVLVKKYFEGYI